MQLSSRAGARWGSPLPQLPARAGLRSGCADFLALEDGIQPGDELTHVERITVEPTAVPTVSSTSLVTPSESSAAAKAPTDSPSPATARLRPARDEPGGG